MKSKKRRKISKSHPWKKPFKDEVLDPKDERFKKIWNAVDNPLLKDKSK